MNLFNKLDGVFSYFEFSKWRQAHKRITLEHETKDCLFQMVGGGVVLAGIFMIGNTMLYLGNDVKFNFWVPGILLLPLILGLISITLYDSFHAYRLSSFNKKVKNLNEEQLRKIIESMSSYSGHYQYDDLILAFHKNKDNMGESLFAHLEPLYNRFIEEKTNQENAQLIEKFKNPSAAKLKHEAENKFKFME